MNPAQLSFSDSFLIYIWTSLTQFVKGHNFVEQSNRTGNHFTHPNEISVFSAYFLST